MSWIMFFRRGVNQMVIQHKFSHETAVIKSKTSSFAITFHYGEIKINKWKFIDDHIWIYPTEIAVYVRNVKQMT